MFYCLLFLFIFSFFNLFIYYFLLVGLSVAFNVCCCSFMHSSHNLFSLYFSVHQRICFVSVAFVYSISQCIVLLHVRVFFAFSFKKPPPTHPSPYSPTYLLIHLSTNSPIHTFISPSIHPFIYYPPIHRPIYRPIYLPSHPHIYLHNPHLTIHPAIHPSNQPFIQPSIHLSIQPSI